MNYTKSQFTAVRFLQYQRKELSQRSVLGENKKNTLKNQITPSEKVKQNTMVLGRE